MPLRVETLPPCSGRTLIIGDVHGCAEEFKSVLDAFGPTPEDSILAVGDLINRGPASAEVLAIARAHRIRSVLGNHELRLLRGWKRGDPSQIKAKDLPTFNQLERADWDWIATWPHVLRIPSLNTLVVHGGFAPGLAWQDQHPGMVTHIQVLDDNGNPARRSEAPGGVPWADRWEGPEHVLYGHTPRTQVLTHPLATGLDTGCVYGWRLTAVSLPDRTFHTARARRCYAED